MRALVVVSACLFACGPKAKQAQPPQLLDSPTIVLHAKRMVDVQSGLYVTDVMVAIKGDRIQLTGPWEPARIPPGTEIVELGDTTLLPGLVDTHVHLAWGSSTNPAEPPGTKEAEATLRAGFTTVRNLGSTKRADFAMRDAIASGQILGPRMHVAGPGIGGPGGACDLAFGGEGRVKSPAEAKVLVDSLIMAGATVIKICTGGDVIPSERDREVVELDEATVRAIVDAAKRRDVKVAAHAVGPKAIAIAVAGGVASIEHGALIDEANARAMAAKGIYLVPTLYRLDSFVAAATPEGKPDLLARRKLAFTAVAAAVKAGVPIAFGTDASLFPHGDNAREFEALVEVGLEPAAAIRAATVDAAKLMNAQYEIGTIAAGKRADIIAVQGDPLQDVKALRHVVFVMKAGDVIRHDLR